MARMDKSMQEFLEQVAEVLEVPEVKPGDAFRTVPLWGSLTGFALAFARGIGEYGSVVFIAGNLPYETEIAPLLIMAKLESFDYPSAAAIAIVMMAASFLVLLALNGYQRWRMHHQGV